MVALLGVGGMGEVYRARDTRLDRPVAIKVLSAAARNDRALRERLEREARSISQLQHPNVCTLFDVGHESGTDFLVMELLEGETLADRLRRGPLPVAEALSVAIKIAAALDRAHSRGIVHRDLKPGNVMLTPDGPKVLDFGLAKDIVARRAPGTDSATPTSLMTSEGTIVGTLQYMAPEQLEGKPVDERSDVFAFGSVLFEMLTGSRPFEGDSWAFATDISSDGRWLIYDTDRSGRFEVCALDLETPGSMPIQLTTEGGRFGTLSPSGKVLYWRSPSYPGAAQILRAEVDLERGRRGDVTRVATTASVNSGGWYPLGGMTAGDDGLIVTEFKVASSGGRVILVRNWVADMRAKLARD